MDERVIELLRELLREQEHDIKQEYTTGEVAKIVDRDKRTVETWCRTERINALKRGRRWVIPHDEVERLKQTHCELLPVKLDLLSPSLRSRYSQSQSVAA